MKSRRTWILGLVLLAAVAIIGFLAFAPDRIPVEVEVVKRESLRVTIEEQGRTRVRESFIVAAPITGRLLRTAVDEGDAVEIGDTLATLLPPPVDPREVASLQAELSVAEARVREARALLSETESANTVAEREASRREELFQQGAISEEAREQYQQAARAAKSRLQTAHASLRATRAQVERVNARLIAALPGTNDEGGLETVAAPVSGTVLFVYEESERVLPAGAPLFELSDVEGLEIVADLLTEQAVRVREGAAVEVTGWGGGSTIPGRVRHVEPKGFREISALGVEEQRVNVIIDLLEAPSALGAEFRVEVAIVTWSADDVLTIPTSAIFRRSSAWWTFVDDDGRARLRSLEIGHRGRERAEVLSGVREGERVVVFPSDLVEDDVRLDPRSAEPSQTAAPATQRSE